MPEAGAIIPAGIGERGRHIYTEEEAMETITAALWNHEPTKPVFAFPVRR
jgi:hypothetical protein